MRGPERPIVSALAAIVTVVGGIALGGCQEQKALRESLAATAGDQGDACAGDTLRPAAAAPAEGLWLFEGASSVQRVAARIGPPQANDKALVVTRPVETVEVSVAGDTIRHRLDAATVSLELLPPLGSRAPGGDSMAG